MGIEDIARGNLATVMGLPPETAFQVQGISELATPTAMADSVDQDIDRALSRPTTRSLFAVARLNATNAQVIDEFPVSIFRAGLRQRSATLPVPMDSRTCFRAIMLRESFGPLAFN